MKLMNQRKMILHDPNVDREFCPFVESPLKECFCFDFQKNNYVKLAVFYCGGNFRQCDIFHKYKGNIVHLE